MTLLCVGKWNGACRWLRYRRGGCWWDCLKWRQRDGTYRCVFNQPGAAYNDA